MYFGHPGRDEAKHDGEGHERQDRQHHPQDAAGKTAGQKNGENDASVSKFC